MGYTGSLSCQQIATDLQSRLTYMRRFPPIKQGWNEKKREAARGEGWKGIHLDVYKFSLTSLVRHRSHFDAECKFTVSLTMH